MIQIFDVAHARARELVTQAPVYLTVNPVEYHGPHLSLHNDRLVSLGLVRHLHERLFPKLPLLVADDLEVGVAPCPGVGTRKTRFALTRELVVDACRALADLGARRVVIMTFHGAPLHSLAIQAGVDALTALEVRAVAPFNVVMQRLLHFDPEQAKAFAPALAHVADVAERETMLRDLPFDYHAGFFETSVAMALAPESVSETARLALPPCPTVTPDAKFTRAAKIATLLRRPVLARELQFAAHGTGWNALRPFPGYTGRPHLASVESGKLFVQAIIDDMAPVVAGVLEGRAESPAPIMAWAERASLGGRLA